MKHGDTAIQVRLYQRYNGAGPAVAKCRFDGSYNILSRRVHAGQTNRRSPCAHNHIINNCSDLSPVKFGTRTEQKPSVIRASALIYLSVGYRSKLCVHIHAHSLPSVAPIRNWQMSEGSINFQRLTRCIVQNRRDWTMRPAWMSLEHFGTHRALLQDPISRTDASYKSICICILLQPSVLCGSRNCCVNSVVTKCT